MVSMARQMYDYYVRPYIPFGEKGQDMVEYALMLAIIVGIGVLIWQNVKIQDKVTNVFNSAGNLMDKAAAGNHS